MGGVSMMGVGAFAVIRDAAGCVLLAHRRDHDLWNLPGGAVEPGESPWAAVVREVREETGLVAEVIQLAAMDYRSERGEVVLTFLCARRGGDFAPNAEADRTAYFTPDALPTNLPPSHRERIASVVDAPLTEKCETLLRVQRSPTALQWLGIAGGRAGFGPRQFKLGAFATIRIDEGVVLCRRRDADFWGQPGGGIEPGEAPWEAVVREVREETGLETHIGRLIGVYCWPADDELIFSFSGAAVGGRLATSDETSAVSVVSFDSLPPNTFAEHRERIADALTHSGPPLLRHPTCLSAPEELRRWRAAHES
jgi:8-oxo-dGTP diphosphatase